MKLIHERAEEMLIQRFRTGSESPHIRHVLHIRGQAFNQKDFETLPELVLAWIGVQDSDVYICHDRDHFIFSPNLTPKTFAQIKEHFQTRFEYDAAVHAKLLSFYDIQDNVLALIELTETKFAKKEIHQKQKAEIQKIEKKIELKNRFSNITPNAKLISSLQSRRRLRPGIEILIVEDDPFSRNLIGSVLSKYNVYFAEDGYEAITNHLQHAPDIIFLDIDLPDVTGHDVLAKILSFDPHVHIVMLSGNSQSENIIAAVKAGAKGFIGKPFTKDKLFQYISKHPKQQLEHMGTSSWN